MSRLDRLPALRYGRVLLAVALLMLSSGSTRAEVLVRWTQDQVPAMDALGVSALVIPLAQVAAIDDAARKGYRVFVEVNASDLSHVTLPHAARGGVVVSGSASPQDLQRLQRSVTAPGSRVLTLDERGKWPHIRLNWVTRRNDVLQVSSRTAQPWLESNGALVRLADVSKTEGRALLSYPWLPITVADAHAGPALENYLVAIAEAGSFGASLVLPLHESFQRALLHGRPDARAEWRAIRRSLDFYAWDLPRHYESIATIGVVAADPLASFEVLNLLTRHNLPFRLIAPDALRAEDVEDLALLVMIDEPGAAHVAVLSAFAERGNTVVLAGPVESASAFEWRRGTPVQTTDEHVSYAVGTGVVLERRHPPVDPNAFAMQVRNLLGPERRVVDIWNGITVVVVPYRDPDDGTVLLSVVNYAHEVRPVQIRVAGVFADVRFESPEQEASLLPFTHRNGHTEFVLPALHVGGRVFLSPQPGQ